jgi:hypothetical protein
MRIRLLFLALILFSPLVLSAASLDEVKNQVANASAKVEAGYKVVSGGNVDWGKAKGQMEVLPALLDSLIQALQGLNLSEATQVKELSIGVKAKIGDTEAEGKSLDLVKLSAKIRDLSLSLGDLKGALLSLNQSLATLAPTPVPDSGPRAQPTHSADN